MSTSSELLIPTIDNLQNMLDHAYDLNFDHEAYYLRFNWKKFNSDECTIEQKIIYKYFHAKKIFDYAFKKWCKIPNTHMDVLSLILRYDDCEIKLYHCELFFQKNPDHLTAKCIVKLSNKIPNEYVDKLLQWYEKFNHTGMLQWHFIHLGEFDNYFKIAHGFDPYDEINTRSEGRKMRKIPTDITDIWINLEENLSNLEQLAYLFDKVEDRVKLIDFVKKHINKENTILTLLTMGLFNDILEHIPTNRVTLVVAIFYHNIKLIDKLADSDTLYYILCYGSRTLIDHYFPNLTLNKIEEILKQLK